MNREWLIWTLIGACLLLAACAGSLVMWLALKWRDRDVEIIRYPKVTPAPKTQDPRSVIARIHLAPSAPRRPGDAA